MKRNAFTLIELLVVVAIIVSLIAILLPSLNKAVEVSQRAVCASNQHQISAGALTFATEHHGKLIPCAARRIQLNIPAANAYGASAANGWTAEDAATNWIAEWGRLGLLESADEINNATASGIPSESEVWDCPSRDYRSQWQVNGTRKNVTTSYQYLGGIKRWTNPWGSFTSRSPVSVAQSQSGWVLLADGTLKIDYAWGQGSSPSSPYAYVDMPNHKADGQFYPAGHNQAYLDGAVEWVDFEDMIYIHSWNTSGSREAYWYQKDLGSYTPPAGAYGTP